MKRIFWIEKSKDFLRLHPTHLAAMRHNTITLATMATMMMFIYLLPSFPQLQGIKDYLPMHTALETVSVVIAALIFAVGWNAYSSKIPGNIVFLSALFFGVSLLDFSHILAYKGMPDFITPGGVEKAIDFWLAGRFLASGGLLLFSLLSLTPLRCDKTRYLLFAAITMLVGLIHWVLLFHPDLLPRTFIPGQGLTPYKVYAEYTIIALNLLTALLLWMRMRRPQPYHAAALFTAMCIMAMSEFFFTLYANATDIYNLAGHIYKAVAYLYVYKAIFVTTVKIPYKELDRSQEELRTKNRLLDAMIENIPNMIFLKDARELRYVLFNKTGEVLTGIDRSNLLGKNDYDLFPKEQADFFISKDRETLKNNHIVDIPDEPIQTPSGTRILHTKKLTIRDTNGEPQYLLGISEDITDRMVAEKALRESEKILKESQSIASIGSYVLDFATMKWRASQALEELFGINQSDEHSPEEWTALIHPEDLEIIMYHFTREVIGRHKPFNHEYRILRQSDNAVRWVHGLGQLHIGSDGTLLTMIGTIQDITERKQTSDTLVKLSLAVEQNPNSIVITDLEGNIEYVNAMFTSVTGFSEQEVLGKNPRLMKSDKTPASTYEEMWAHLTRGETWSGELINRRKDGSIYIESAIISPVKRPDGSTINYVAIKEDITQQKKLQEHIEKLAHFDQLTGLPNRVLLNDRVKYLLNHAQRKAMPLAVLFLDLDHFKDINDTLGHSVGDSILIETAKRLKNAIRDEDTVSRLGGDEFILLFPDTDANGAVHIATKLMEVISASHHIEQYELTITPSIGIAIYPTDGEDFETLLKNADTAMYRVKHDSRNNFHFFTPQMQSHSIRNLELVNALRHALKRNELHLHYQPQLSIQDGRLIGAEALLRWKHPTMGMISPAEFIPIAEESRQIIQIGEWVLRTAIQQMKAWHDEGFTDMAMAVNLSAVQFRQPNFIENVTNILQETGVAHRYLELELTEAVAMHDPKAAISIMNGLHDIGIRMSIDDFGTGYSSLSYLKQFKVYKLKIDQSFVRDITKDSDDRAIVSAIIDMANNLGLQTIAEGVETAEQLAFLRLHGCHEVQGYYFSKPLPAEQFNDFMRTTISFEK